MRAIRMITQPFNRYAAVALCMAAFILASLAHAETAALQHDNNGNITQRSVTNGTTTQTTTYTYDPLNRLTGESGPAKTQTITYDENGNRKSDGAGNYVYETTSNRMSTRLGLAVTYDTAGRLTADGTGKTFSYNQAGQLYQVKQGGTLIATYTYDYRGLRISKDTTASAPQGAQSIVYIYDQWGKIMEEFTSTGTLIRSYIWRNDAPVAQVEHTSGGDKTLYFDPDHLNTPRAAMDETGKVVWRWESDAFGSTLPNEDVDGDGNKTTINMRFGGWYADVESGLFYAWNRYYSPLIGGFIQPDRLDVIRQAVNPLYAGYSEPTDLQRALNQPYTYVNGNPITRIDPFGLLDRIVYNGSTLVGYDDFAKEFEVPAVSGPWGKGRLPAGNYNGKNLRKRKDNKAMMCNGSGWSLDLDPTFRTDRTLLRIHPDGNVPGTEGCIGPSCSVQQTVYDSLRDYFNTPGSTSIPVIVNFPK